MLIIAKSKTQTKKTTALLCCHCLSVCPYLSWRLQASIYIVQPVNEVEESKGDWKNDP